MIMIPLCEICNYFILFVSQNFVNKLLFGVKNGNETFAGCIN